MTPCYRLPRRRWPRHRRGRPSSCPPTRARPPGAPTRGCASRTSAQPPPSTATRGTAARGAAAWGRVRRPWRCWGPTCRWARPRRLRGSGRRDGVEKGSVQLGPCLVLQIHPKFHYAKRRFPHHIKMLINIWSTKCRWNYKLIVQFCCTLRDEHFESN
jgi:hypothetical protein